MPLINVKVIENVFTAEQKRDIVERLTEAMVAIEGENMRPASLQLGDVAARFEPFKRVIARRQSRPRQERKS